MHILLNFVYQSFTQHDLNETLCKAATIEGRKDDINWAQQIVGEEASFYANKISKRSQKGARNFYNPMVLRCEQTRSTGDRFTLHFHFRNFVNSSYNSGRTIILVLVVFINLPNQG